MKILIIVKSKHYDNTLKIAEAMSEVAPATITDLENASFYNLNEYDIVGLGSGIYFGKHDKDLFKFAEKHCNDIKLCFVFSTSGSKKFDKNNEALVKFLERKNIKVLSSFGCLGETRYFPLSIIGGINKNRPDFDDFEAAQRFIDSIIEKSKETK